MSSEIKYYGEILSEEGRKFYEEMEIKMLFGTTPKTWLEFEEYKTLKDWFKEKDNTLAIYLKMFGAGKVKISEE